MGLISVSLLSANFANLKEEINLLQAAGADMLHLDIMDGHFVPNLTFGPDIVKTIKNCSKIPLDVHLMINQPENWIELYAKNGADIITIHPEATIHLDRTIALIKHHGCKAGIALLPTSLPSILEYIVDEIDLVLIMSVNPGFGGQKFLPMQLKKIQQLCNMLADLPNKLLSVDGGINDQTATQVAQAGANMIVSGSYIFSGNYQERIMMLRDAWT